MEYSVFYRNIPMQYRVSGTGKPLVLLHGYLESIDVWNGFEGELAKDFKVISIDLLGHGKTGNLGDIHTMKQMAEAVRFILHLLHLKHFYLLGHSMGGYVAAQYSYDFPQEVDGLILLHSAPKADSQDKKANRKRIIELVKNGKKAIVVAQHTPKLFASGNIPIFAQHIERLKIIAGNTTEQGIIAALNGMMQRMNLLPFLNNSDFPVLMIVGKKDNFIPFSVAEEILHHSNGHIKSCILENSGHVGFIEEAEKTITAIKNFINNE